MRTPARSIALCCLVILIALDVVGAVSHGVLRHIVQTLPLWIPIALSFRDKDQAKWAALPCLIFWLGIMILIWLYLLGFIHIISGHFSAVEIAMTLVVGAACILGLRVILRWATGVSYFAAAAVAFIVAALQLIALKVSLLPSIAYR